MTLTVTAAPLIANILGGNRKVGRTQALRLQAVVIDPDQNGALEGVSYEWSCQESATLAACPLTAPNSTLTFEVPAGAFEPLRTYAVFFTARKAGADPVVASVSVYVVAEVQSSLQVMYAARFASEKVNLNEELTFIVQKQLASGRRRRVLVNTQSDAKDTHLSVKVVYDGAVVTTLRPPTYVVQLVIDRYLNGLYRSGRESVQFVFTYADPYLGPEVLSSTVDVSFNLPPQLGSLRATPTNGTALTTPFLFAMADYIDQDTPFQYKFGYYATVAALEADRQAGTFANMVLLSDWQSNNFV